ncbi:MAG TPA: choice-of-anchor D domain-containing protein [Candidatus Binataceae bacterium]|nr:choice-of-anchor D domain-containing protein [Candidatus Binataceae bacterium]
MVTSKQAALATVFVAGFFVVSQGSASATSTLTFSNPGLTGKYLDCTGQTNQTTVSNNTSSAVTMNTLSFSGTNAADFSVAAGGSNPCTGSPLQVPASGSCTLSITFTPTLANVTESATLAAYDSNNNSLGSYAITTGKDVPISMSPVAGGYFSYGNIPATQTQNQYIEITNYSTSTITLGATTSGTDPADYTIGGGTSNGSTRCGATLAGNATACPSSPNSCTIDVTFQPTAGGARNAKVTVTDSPDPIGSRTITVAGVGSWPTVLPYAVGFPNTDIGNWGGPETVTVTNTQAQALTLSTSITGTHASAYFINGGTCTTGQLAGLSSCTYEMMFAPNSTGDDQTATLKVTASPDGSVYNPYSVGLAGNGFASASGVSVTPASLTFGSVNQGSSNSMQVNVFNNSSSAVSLSTNTLSAPFSISGGTCVSSLNAGASCNYTVKMVPTATASSSATLTITDSGSNQHNVSLSGAGTVPMYAIIFFGNQYPYESTFGIEGFVFAGSRDLNNALVPKGTSDIQPDTIGFEGINSVAVDYSGNVYTADITGGPSNLGSVSVYKYSAGRYTLAATITGSALNDANAGLLNPFAIAADSGGNIYVANGNVGKITIYKKSSWSGCSSSPCNLTPDATIGGSNTGLSQPDAITVDSSGYIYVLDYYGGANVFSGSVDIFPPLATSGFGNLNEAPTASISGVCQGWYCTPIDDTGFHWVNSIAVDPSGYIYVLNVEGNYLPARTVNSVTVYPPLATLTSSNPPSANCPAGYPNCPDWSPIVTVSGTSAKLANATGIAVDSTADFYLTTFDPEDCQFDYSGPNEMCYTGAANTINEYSPISLSGCTESSPCGTIDPAPTNTFVDDTHTNLNTPLAVAVDSNANIYVANDPYFGGQNPYAGGSSVPQNVAVFAPVSSGAGTITPTPMATIVPSSVAQLPFYGGAGDAYGPTAGALGANGTYNSITNYGGGAASTTDGGGQPSAYLVGNNTMLDNPVGLWLDPGFNLYAANCGQACNGTTGNSSTKGSITVYAPGIPNQSGNASPIYDISGSNTGLDGPVSLTTDSGRNIYVANLVGGSSGTGSITVYSEGSNGNVSPSATISGSNTGLNYPYGIALDQFRNIYVANCETAWPCGSGSANIGTITVYAAGSNGNVTPTATISGGSTSLDSPVNVFVDPIGYIYVTNHGQDSADPIDPGSLTIYSPGSSGNVAPFTTVTGESTGVFHPWGIVGQF